MIRRDYILRMIEEFFRLLARIDRLKQNRQWGEAESTVRAEIERLVGTGGAALVTLSDTEIFSRLLEGGELHSAREKAFMLARLLLENAETAEAGDPPNLTLARQLRLKALHLLLHTALRDDIPEWPEYVPTIDRVLQLLADSALPLHTCALLMQHFEHSGQFGKAEDTLYRMLEIAPEEPALRQLGISFYHRLLARSDAALAGGDLPRAEVEAGLKELHARRH